jgi:heme/copper-type cytochrome/quinol oxidase subunit 3
LNSIETRMAEGFSVHNFEITRLPNHVSMRPHAQRPFSWLLFWISALAGVAFFLIPAFIIYPFRHQTASQLALAMDLHQRAPLGTLIALVVCLLFAIALWQAHNLRRKVVLSVALLLVAFSAVFSRLNYYEWMFHPVDSPQFEPEAASKLESGEMILALQFNDDARAYPIREMAYHHILNDLVSGIPVAVTY